MPTSWRSSGAAGGRVRAVAAELEFRRRPSTAAVAVAGDAGAVASTLLEESLIAVGRLAGLPPGRRLQITEAKAFLRTAHGAAGGLMASRLSRLSKGRNAVVHPDVGLPSAIAGMGACTEGAVRRLLVAEPGSGDDCEGSDDSTATLGGLDPAASLLSGRGSVVEEPSGTLFFCSSEVDASAQTGISDVDACTQTEMGLDC